MKKNISIFLIAIILLSFSGIKPTLANLGPVHVQLNITGEKPGNARANAVNSFIIYVRFNVDIEAHDWVKVWFPTYEASWDEEDICDGLPEIRGVGLEHPRFVPNEKYFEIYKNQEEFEIGKLYKILNEHDVDTDFYEPTDCKELSENCRLRADPSGLGYWLMGTVMPSLPKDQSDRKERTAQIIYTTYFAYPTCSECQGYPIMVQTENECSFQKNSYVGIEAWRSGYNPIDYHFSKATGIIAPATPGRYRIRVATQGEPTPVESDSFVLPCSQISQPVFECYENFFDKKKIYNITFETGEGGALDAGNSLIKIKLPEGLTAPKKTRGREVLVNGVRCKADIRSETSEEGTIATIIPSVNVSNLGYVEITFFDSFFGHHLTESDGIEVLTSSEPEWVSSDSLIFTHKDPSKFMIEDIVLSNSIGSYKSSYLLKLLFNDDYVIPKTDTVEIDFPTGTIFPKEPDSEFVKITQGTKNESGNIKDGKNIFVKSCETSGTTIKLILGKEHYFSDYVEIEFMEDFGIINSAERIIKKMKVTIADHSEESDFIELLPPPLETTLKFLDPDEPDGCNGWYKTPPVLSLSCRNPDAIIRVWYDNDPIDRAIMYWEPRRLAPGSQRPIIHFQAIYGDEIEEPQSVQLFIDTVPPAIKIMQPGDEIVYTSKDSFTITGKRDFIEMLTNGQTYHQVADGVYISNNHGEYIEILEPTIFNVFNPEGIAQEWEHEVELVEGENIITILGRDQACNEETWVRTIIRDTTVPYLEFISPIKGERLEKDSLVRIRVKSESDAIVYINKEIASIEKDLGDGTSIFYTELIIPKQDTMITILAEATDRANNESSHMAEFWIDYSQTKLKLWIDSEKFFKNDEQISDLDPMPTTKSPPLPKALGGNTYMPVRSVLEAIGADIEWISSERRVDVKLGDITLQLWIDNPVARINGLDKKIVRADGKTPLYPTIVNDRTMLPLRFACESVGADVNWIADGHAIEIVYPSDTVGD